MSELHEGHDHCEGPDRADARPTAGERHAGTGVSRVVTDMARVQEGPGVLETEVGAGYAVALVSSSGRLGGLLNIGPNYFSRSLEESQEPAWLAGPIRRFLSQFDDRRGALGEISAAVVGGADVLALAPERTRWGLTVARASSITRFLAVRDILVVKSEVGGKDWRRVRLDVAKREVTAEVIPCRSPSSPPPFAAPDRSPDEAGFPIAGQRVTVDIGQMRVARSPIQLLAVLGSCVGIAMYDPGAKVGGLAHVMLPCRRNDDASLTKYADSAVPVLMTSLKRMGADPSRVQAKLAGGASVLFLSENGGVSEIGKRNIAAARTAVTAAGVRIVGEDLGGVLGRKILIDLRDFRVRSWKLARSVEP